jgi:vacuolar protein-sorting-associated protein 4
MDTVSRKNRKVYFTSHDIKNNYILFCSCSAADIAVICREALFRPLRQLMSATHFKRVNSEQVSNPKPDSPRQLWSVCSSDDSNAELITIDKIEPNELDVPPVTMVSSYEGLLLMK